MKDFNNLEEHKNTTALDYVVFFFRYDFSFVFNKVSKQLKFERGKFYSIAIYTNTTALDYVVLDENDNLIYKTKSGLSESVNAAIAHRDTILNITINDTTVGKVIIYNDGRQDCLRRSARQSL